MVNHYKNECLVKAGRKWRGTLDFYQFHSYSWQHKFDEVSPFKNHNHDYGLHKPIVIGEFNEEEGGGRTINQLFDHAYKNGYSGAWSWDLVKHGQDQRAGILRIKDYHGNGKINIAAI
ncbi:mannan endo-1 [Elysia marginata]|uniref:Mannan endo-1 n=1 Tax=Elysia marginata TaxID=1093978 RepID=A0AAV4GAY4_9GAST|nr:mannan endo-1 [Elysia marginata]